MTAGLFPPPATAARSAGARCLQFSLRWSPATRSALHPLARSVKPAVAPPPSFPSVIPAWNPPGTPPCQDALAVSGAWPPRKHAS